VYLPLDVSSQVLEEAADQVQIYCGDVFAATSGSMNLRMVSNYMTRRRAERPYCGILQDTILPDQEFVGRSSHSSSSQWMINQLWAADSYHDLPRIEQKGQEPR
jgi:hypothetical protein